MKKNIGYTIIQNELLDESQLTIPSRYLFMVLQRFSGQDETCYPSQKKLSKILNLSTRQVRTYLTELVNAELISINRSGFNKPNTYTLAKKYRKYTSTQSKSDEKQASTQLGSAYPLQRGNQLPPKTTYRKVTDKRGSVKGFQALEETMKRLRLVPQNRVTTIKGNNNV